MMRIFIVVYEAENGIILDSQGTVPVSSLSTISRLFDELKKSRSDWKMVGMTTVGDNIHLAFQAERDRKNL